MFRRILIPTTLLVLALHVAGCSNHDTAQTGTGTKRKVYYAHDVQTGSHMPRAFAEPTPTPGPQDSAPNGVNAGDRPFANSSAAGSYAGQH